MRRPLVKTVLVVLAVLGIFAALDMIGHRSTTPYLWPKLAAVLTFSAGCLLLARDRESLDTFSAVIAGLSALFAVAMTAGDQANPNWWPFFLGFTGAAVLFTLLTRKRRATLLAIAAIVGFRLLVFVILYMVHR